MIPHLKVREDHIDSTFSALMRWCRNCTTRQHDAKSLDRARTRASFFERTVVRWRLMYLIPPLTSSNAHREREGAEFLSKHGRESLRAYR